MEEKRDEVLIAETDVKERIRQVLAEKDDLFRFAKEKAKKQLKTYDDELRGKTQEKITELIMFRQETDHIEEKTKSDLEQIHKTYERNKETVIQYLFDTVTKVDIHIPDVVIGNFEENFK